MWRRETTTYICKGTVTESYTPHFAVFGFRYVLVEGAGEAGFNVVAVYSDLERSIQREAVIMCHIWQKSLEEWKVQPTIESNQRK